MIGIPDSKGLVELEPGIRVPVGTLIEAARRHAEAVGGSVEVVEGRVVYHGPIEQQPPLAVGNADTDRRFEGHPFFHRRLKIGGRDAFIVRGPEEPVVLAGSQPDAVFVRRRCAVFVELPEQPEVRRFYSRQFWLEYQIGGAPRATKRHCDRVEAGEIVKAAQVLRDLGLLLAERCDQCGAPRADFQHAEETRCPNHALPEPYSSCDGTLVPQGASSDG